MLSASASDIRLRAGMVMDAISCAPTRQPLYWPRVPQDWHVQPRPWPRLRRPVWPGTWMRWPPDAHPRAGPAALRYVAVRAEAAPRPLDHRAGDAATGS